MGEHWWPLVPVDAIKRTTAANKADPHSLFVVVQ